MICTLGNFSTKLLRGDPTGITRLHGQPEVLTLGRRAVRLYPIYHPAAALYTPRMLETLREDFARLPRAARARRARAAAAEALELASRSRRRLRAGARVAAAAPAERWAAEDAGEPRPTSSACSERACPDGVRAACSRRLSDAPRNPCGKRGFRAVVEDFAHRS